MAALTNPRRLLRPYAVEFQSPRLPRFFRRSTSASQSLGLRTKPRLDNGNSGETGPKRQHQTPFRQPRSFSPLSSTVIEPSGLTGCSHAQAIGLLRPLRISSWAERLTLPLYAF